MMMEEPRVHHIGGKTFPIARTWIQWLKTLEDHDLYLDIDIDYLTDKMNYIGLKAHFKGPKRFHEAKKLMMSKKVPTVEDLSSEPFLELNTDATELYGMIH